MPNGLNSLRFLLAGAACIALLAGCATKDGPATTGSIDRSSRGPVDQATKLRAAGKPAEAANLLRSEVAKNPNSKPLMLIYARALSESGQSEEALSAFQKAYDPKRPDWRIPNAEGALLDQLGRMPEAQTRYQAALALAPGEPVILSNLGLSLALSQKPAEAEVVLRRAVEHEKATPKMRQNLALVLALQGKYAEAETIARKDLPATEAAANVKYWKDSFKPKAAAAAAPAPAPPPKKSAAPKPAAKPAPKVAKPEEPAVPAAAPAKPAEAPAPLVLDLRT